MFLLYQLGLPAVCSTRSGEMAGPASACAAGVATCVPVTEGAKPKPTVRTDIRTALLRRVRVLELVMVPVLRVRCRPTARVPQVVGILLALLQGRAVCSCRPVDVSGHVSLLTMKIAIASITSSRTGRPLAGVDGQAR